MLRRPRLVEVSGFDVACYSPLQGFFDSSGRVVFSRRKGTDVEVTVPCGTCVGCRIARSRMWALRIVHESKLWDRNCFVTLTYDPEHLPPHGSLRYSDVQAFHKRLRWSAGPFRFFAVGEYGEALSRPHYHVCYFNYFPSDARRLRSLSEERFASYSSKSLEETWGLGQVHIGELTYASAKYASGYIFKKQHGDRGEAHYKSIDADGVWHRLEPEFCRMSLRPGIGRGWYERFPEDFHGRDYVVLDGKKFAVPKYYDKLLERSDPMRMSGVREDREFKSLPNRADNTPERLEVKAQVARALLEQQDKRLQK